MPQVSVPGDSIARDMARFGQLFAFSKARAVWRFGFAPGSRLAEAFHVWTVEPLWVLSVNKTGRVIEVFAALWTTRHDGLPSKFKNIIAASM